MSRYLAVKDWGTERKYTSLSKFKILSKKTKSGRNHISQLTHFEGEFLDVETYVLYQVEDGTETVLPASMSVIL